MAHQDYVSRQKNNNKGKKNPYKKSPTETSATPLKTKVIALSTLIALAIFSYFLWSIKDNSVDDHHNAFEPIIEEVATRDEVELPVYDEEADFDFIEGLKDQKVEAGKYEVNNKGPYLMQCGSFKQLHQAEELKANIAFSGIPSKVRQTKGSNGTWFKVVLGPYERKRLAENDKHKLARNKINHCQIWLWR